MWRRSVRVVLRRERRLGRSRQLPAVDQPGKERVGVPIGLGSRRRVPPVVEDALKQERQLGGEVDGLVRGNPVPQHVEVAAQDPVGVRPVLVFAELGGQIVQPLVGPLGGTVKGLDTCRCHGHLPLVAPSIHHYPPEGTLNKGCLAKKTPSREWKNSALYASASSASHPPCTSAQHTPYITDSASTRAARR